MVGSARKRMLMLWQAVEMSRAMDKPDQATLALARRALEPPADPTDIDAIDADLVSRAPLASGVPRHWSIVRCGCIEGAAPSVLQPGNPTWHDNTGLVEGGGAELTSSHSRHCLVTVRQLLSHTRTQ